MEIVAGLPLKYLRLESPKNPMNISELVFFKAPKNCTVLVQPALDAIKSAIYDRVSHTKMLRQRLVESPFQLANPVWIDDPYMDISYHVQQSSIASEMTSGTNQDLLETSALLSSQSFDRGSPLWHLHLITSEKNNNFALACIAHRSLLYRLQGTLFDALFPANIAFNDPQDINAVSIAPTKNRPKIGFGWLPDSIPSRNDLLALAKTDWLTLPKQTRLFGSTVVNRWAKQKIAKAIVNTDDQPPNWISAPRSIFNQPTGQTRDYAFVALSSTTTRKLLRVFKGFDIRDLIFTLLSRTLQDFLDGIDHHTKDELVALIQCHSLRPNADQAQDWTPNEYQLLRLPTHLCEPLDQLRCIFERRAKAQEYSQLFSEQTGIGVVPSSILSFLIHAYNKFGIHHFHKPVCNLVISEQPPTQGATTVNNFKRQSSASFASLLPNIGLHVSYWIEKDTACISFTTGSTCYKAHELAQAFEHSIESLQSSLRYKTQN